MSVFSPRKDQCDICISAEIGHVRNEELQRHLVAKEKAQAEKKADKEVGFQDSSISVWSMDAQGVLLCPITKASALYYRTKLQVHNFTLHEMIKNDGYCYVWDETDGSLSSEVFTYIQFSHFKSFLETNPHVKELIIWSDGCSYLNKNSILSNAYCQLSLENDITIVQKYLVVGHTHMECDAMHSTIERNLKTDIFTPRDLALCRQTARSNPRPYIVSQLSFKDFKKMSEVRFNTIRQGRKVGDPTVNELCAIMYKNGQLFFKLFHEDNDWKNLPTRIATNTPHPIWIPLFPSRRPISDRKFQDLQFMKKVMPTQVHAYFDQLPHE